MASQTPMALEVEILTAFLLSRASLPDIISLSKFTDLFPVRHRSNPQIVLLYRELQLTRRRQCRIVEKKINGEALAGAKIRGQLAKEKREQRRAQDGGEEVVGGIELFGGPPEQPLLPLPELLDMMERAVQDLEDEKQHMERECDEILERVRGIVDEMSDLRYGKLANPGTEKQVVRQLQNLTETCERKLGDSEKIGDDGVDGDVAME